MDIVAGTNTDTYWPIKKPKKWSDGHGGLGFTIGSSKNTHALREKGHPKPELQHRGLDGR